MTLFDRPTNGTPTSNAASEQHRNTDQQRTAVLAAIRESPDGLTREEICTELGLGGDSVRPRVWELARRGLVTERGQRATVSGRMAAIVRTSETKEGKENE